MSVARLEKTCQYSPQYQTKPPNQTMRVESETPRKPRRGSISIE